MAVMEKPEAAKLIISIVNRGQGKAVARVYGKHRVSWHYQSAGEGTASSELLDVLGFGGTERDILLSLGSGSSVDQLMRLLKEDYPDELRAKGIAFDMKLTGMNSIVAAALSGQGRGLEENGGTAMDSTVKNNLIFIIVNQGHTDEVMNTARAAGARGGTIIRSRYAGGEENEQFFGITVQGEKEIIFIMAPAETRNAIMETVNKKHGLKTAAGAVIFSAALDHVVRFSEG